MPDGQAEYHSNPPVGPSSVPAANSIFHLEEHPTPLGATSDAPMRVIEIDPHTDPRWEVFVTSHPQALIFHHPLWLQVIERAYGYKAISLVCEAGGSIVGVLPLFRTHGLLTGRRLASLPHTPTAGPLTLNDQATAALLHAAIERVGREYHVRLQLKSPCLGLERLADSLIGVPWEATYVLELPAQSAGLRFGDSRNHAQIKRAMNKATRQGVRVRPAESEADLQAWYRLYLDTLRWHGIPPRPYRFFKVVWELLRPRGFMRLLLAEQHRGGRPKLLAGSLFLMFGGTVSYAFNGCHRNDLLLRPNDAIHWQAIHDACDGGYRRYDFGEVSEDNLGLIRYKRKWGAEPVQLFRYYYPVPRDLGIGMLAAGSYSRRLGSAILRRLPLVATSLLGEWVYKLL